MPTSGRVGVVLAPLIVWAVVLCTKPAVWVRQPRMTSGTAPPFAYIGTFAELFAATLLAVAVFHPNRAIQIVAAMVGGGFAFAFFWIAVHL